MAEIDIMKHAVLCLAYEAVDLKPYETTKVALAAKTILDEVTNFVPKECYCKEFSKICVEAGLTPGEVEKVLILYKNKVSDLKDPKY